MFQVVFVCFLCVESLSLPVFSGGVVELFGFLWAVPALDVREGALWIFRYYGVVFFHGPLSRGPLGLGCRFGGCGGPIVVCTVVGCIFFHYIVSWENRP